LAYVFSGNDGSKKAFFTPQDTAATARLLALPYPEKMTATRTRLSATAFATLLLIALMMGSNHVAARFAFQNGVDVATAVTIRSGITALVVAGLLWHHRVSMRLTRQHQRGLLAVGLLVGIQSLCLYSSVARLPVALALLAFNTYPLWTALWDRIVYGHKTDPTLLRAMPVMLLGLALALDVLGAASGLGAQAQWAVIGVGVAFALTAAATFGLALVFTQHEAGDLDGRLRTLSTMSLVFLLGGSLVLAQGGLHLPNAPAGWWGLAALTFLYGTAFTIMFTVLPRLGVVGNSAIMNVEPVFALVLAWVLLDQAIAPIQVIGGLLVVATVMFLGLRKR
jgi:drug/metabolite transporter (DMT)-like permease